MDDLCRAKHKMVDDTLIRHERQLDIQGGKIDVLERSDAVNSTEIKNLCKCISAQTNAIWGLVMIVAAALVGFVFWYIQTGG